MENTEDHDWPPRMLFQVVAGIYEAFFFQDNKHLASSAFQKFRYFLADCIGQLKSSDPHLKYIFGSPGKIC